MTRYNRFFAVFCAFLFAVLVTGCGEMLTDLKTFDYDLRGTWVTNQNANEYSGQLVISYDKITIWGYEANSTYETDYSTTADRPFKDFTRGAVLSGYSEDGKLFIEDAGMLQNGIPYLYYKSGGKFLRFTFGLRTEILKYTENY